MEADLDTVLTALYVTVDDLLIEHPEVVAPCPPGGWKKRTSDAEMITLAVACALLGFSNERRWVRYAKKHLACYFPRIPNQPGYNKRLRRLADLIAWVHFQLARRCDQCCDDVWIADSTPVECGRSRETAKRSENAGFAEYGFCASHSRYFWGLRLHLLATLAGLVIGYALTGAKADERETLIGILDGMPRRPGQTLLTDKGYRSAGFEQLLADEGIALIRGARKDEPPRPGSQFLKPLRQVIESINSTLKTHLDVEHHGAHTPLGIITRIATQLLALTAGIWHNQRTGQPVRRSLIAYDHQTGNQPSSVA